MAPKSSTALGVVFAAATLLVVSVPASAETLKVGLRELTGGKGNPYSGGIQTPGIYTWSAVYEQLTKNGEGGKSEPLLATEWRNTDPSTWRVRLRPNVVFANGERFDAAAVKATYDFLLKSDTGKLQSTGKTIGPFITDVVVVDDLTIDLKTVRPNPLTPKYTQAVTIVPPKAWADKGIEGFTNSAIGTGPYNLEFRQGGAVALPNPTSWQKRQNVDRIEFFELGEGPARAQALMSGQIDIDVLVSRDALPQVEAAGMKVYAKRASRTLGLSFVTMRNKQPVTTGPLADVRVRQALNHAVNKQVIVDAIYQGKGAPATQSAPSVVNGYNPNLKAYEYDPAKARQLLSDAGYANGFDMEIRAIMTDTAISQVYQAAVQDITRVGVRVKLIPQQFSEWIQFYLNGNWPYEGFGFGHDLTTQLDAAQAFLQYTSCKKPDPYYCNQEEMKLVDQIEVEFDEPKRIALLHRLLEMNRNNAPIIYLIEFDEGMGYNPKITNFQHTNLWIPYNELVLAPARR
jgi:peptide/nickel transport system substrate-binding protein